MKTSYLALKDNVSFAQWFQANLPDTTLLVKVQDDSGITAKHIATHVSNVIASVGAEYNSIYVAFITDEDYILNNR